MGGVTLDFSKAFDTIQHPILVKKTICIWNHGYNILKLIESYLANRQQFVTINNRNSTQKIIACGVPQGSILGSSSFYSVWLMQLASQYILLVLCNVQA